MQYDKRKKAEKIIKIIDKNPEMYLITHYSCESFYDITDGRTPRITSIAVYNFESAQTDSFSLHKIAERKHIDLSEIEDKYDQLEKQMLTEFFKYAKEHKEYKWIHWNMRDMNYGFKAIENRYLVLGGTPFYIPDTNKIDLSRLLIQYYGVGYIDHPRMEKLIDYNHISAKDFLSGADEAIAFENKEYVKLHMSTLRKVDVFANILNRVINNKLKVKSKWYEMYGLSFQGIFNYCREKWWIQLIWSAILLLLGAILGKLI